MSKSRDYKERQVHEKYHKVFGNAHVAVRIAVMFPASALSRSHSAEILKMATKTGGNASLPSVA